MVDEPLQPPPRPPQDSAYFPAFFERWLAGNQGRFTVPLQIKCGSPTGLELVFPGCPQCLVVLVRQTGLDVAVMWRGQVWDLLMSLDVLAAPCAGGYACALCDDLSQTWPTLEALWADHLCEPLLSMVNQRLGPARWLVLGAVGDDFSPGPNCTLTLWVSATPPGWWRNCACTPPAQGR